MCSIYARSDLGGRSVGERASVLRRKRRRARGPHRAFAVCALQRATRVRRRGVRGVPTVAANGAHTDRGDAARLLVGGALRAVGAVLAREGSIDVSTV